MSTPHQQLLGPWVLCRPTPAKLLHPTRHAGNLLVLSTLPPITLYLVLDTHPLRVLGAAGLPAAASCFPPTSYHPPTY